MGETAVVTTAGMWLQQAQVIAQIVNALGTLGLLVLAVAAFYRGDIISKPVWDRMTDKLVEGFSRELEAKFATMEKNLSELKTKKRGDWS